MKKNNTDQFPALDGWGIISDICHKAKNNILMQRALKKVSNMNQSALQKFLGEVQTLFGRLKKIVSDISLEATASFIIRDFFKTKNESGIFAYVDSDIFNWFDSKVKIHRPKNWRIMNSLKISQKKILLAMQKPAEFMKKLILPI